MKSMGIPCHLEGKGGTHFEIVYQVQTTHDVELSHTKETCAIPLSV